MRKHHKTDIFGVWEEVVGRWVVKWVLGQQERMTGLGSLNTVLFLRCWIGKHISEKNQPSNQLMWSSGNLAELSTELGFHTLSCYIASFFFFFNGRLWQMNYKMWYRRMC